MDFLAGNQDYRCTPWGNPTRNVFGWQRPCYLLSEGYADSFRALLEETDWESYGTGNYEKCANCMVHCGYEATAVADTLAHPLCISGASRRKSRWRPRSRSTASARPNTCSKIWFSAYRSAKRGSVRVATRRSALCAEKLSHASLISAGICHGRISSPANIASTRVEPSSRIP